MRYTFGIALLQLSKGEAGKIWRESNPDRIISSSGGLLTLSSGGDNLPYLATEEDEGAFDWVTDDNGQGA